MKRAIEKALPHVIGYCFVSFVTLLFYVLTFSGAPV